MSLKDEGVEIGILLQISSNEEIARKRKVWQDNDIRDAINILKNRLGVKFGNKEHELALKFIERQIDITFGDFQ